MTNGGFSPAWLSDGGRPSGGTAQLTPAPSHRPVQRVRGGVLLALWIFVSLLSVGPSYLHYLAERQPVPWSRLFSEMTGSMMTSRGSITPHLHRSG